MQQPSLRLAAVLAVALLSPAASLAFDIQSGSSGPGAAAPYADPELRFDPDGTPRYDVDTDAATRFSGADGTQAPNGMTIIDLGPGSRLQFGVSGNAGAAGRTEPGWDNPQAGRMTR